MTEVLDRAINLTRDEEGILAAAGKRLVDAGRFDDALPVFGVLVNLISDNAFYHRAYGICCEQVDDIDQAMSSLTRAIELMPEDVHALTVRAAIFSLREEHDAARADLDAAERHVQPSDRRILDKIAAIRAGLG